MSELSGLVPCDSGQELARSAGTPAQPLVFLSQPPYEVRVDASEGHGQLELVESPVVAEPALHDRVDLVGKVFDGRAGAPVKPPAADYESDGFEGRRTNRWAEADEQQSMPVHRRPRLERVPQERKLLMLV